MRLSYTEISRQAYYQQSERFANQCKRETPIADFVRTVRKEDPGIGQYKLWLMGGTIFGKGMMGRDVIVYPDHDAYDEWTNSIRDMQNVANFVIAKTCENESELGKTYDLADLILEWKLKSLSK